METENVAHLHFTATSLPFIHGTGCLDVVPQKEHILYCAVHLKYRMGNVSTLEKKGADYKNF